MAQSSNAKKKSNTSSKAKPSTNKTTKASARSEVKKQPIRREVTAIVFAFAALLAIIGMFSTDGIVVGALGNFLKGIVGYGFWVCALVFVLVACIQGFHRGRPVALRTFAALSLPVFIGALCDLVFGKLQFSSKTLNVIISELYAGGQEMNCGGVLGGLLSYGCKLAFNGYGAIIILFFALLILLMIAFNITPKKIIEWFDGRELSEYELQPEPEEPVIKMPERRGRAARIKAHNEAKEAEKFKEEVKAEEPPKPVEEKKARRRVSAIDIPLDDDDLFDKKPEKKETEIVIDDTPVDSIFGERNRVKPEKKNQVNHTDNVAPISVEEAASIAGVTVGDVSSAEISDPPKKKISRAEVAMETAAITNQIESQKNEDVYEFPPIYLLKKGHATVANAEEELRLNRDRLESTIKSFGVSARVVSTTHGPTVTRYDLALEQGVKLSRLTNLAGDIALALGVVSVRIAPIPDKISTVGIEVPNKAVSTVYLRDIIDSPKFSNAKSKLSFAVGKDIAGDPVVGNVSKLPHLLIAGTTGSGKSVCMNSLIISLLYKSDPEDVKLIMIDPKMVELGVYNGIPHLYIPVVTDPKKAAGALQWAVTEMLKRYRLFSEVNVRNIASYNDYLIENGQPKLPNVVVVIDELADLMLVASKEVEESICRVAQMGRAAGMHLIIATQRPSADVITGLMKANIPSRIAFAVSSALESRIILDSAGAEKLIGMGDMLYAPIGCGKPLRVQGAFVSDEERDQVVEFIKKQSTAQYSDEVMAQIEKAAEEKNGGKNSASDSESSGVASDYDELLPQAVDVIFDTKQASVSMLQRRLKLGYSRAARIVDQMEELGIVGPFEGSKPRQILITKEQWAEMQYANGTAPTEVLQTQLELDDADFSDEEI